MARKPKQTSETAIMDAEKITHKPPPFIEVTNQEAIVAGHPSRCGGELRAAREKLGLTSQEIASRLRLSSKQIEALEADNFAVLPEATIVKGFIRNYAKQLKIDANPLIDAYSVIVPNKAPQSFTLHPSVDMKVTEYQKPNMLRNILFGTFLALSLGAWLFYQNYVQKPSPVKPTAELVQSGPPEPLPEAALPAAERPAEQASTELTLPNSSTTVVDATAAPPANVPPSAPVAAAPVAPPVAENPPSTSLSTNPLAPSQLDRSLAEPSPAEPAQGQSKLEFAASQETWISVTDASGREIYNKTLFEGNRESIVAKPPVNITVGNSLGTTLSVNGKSVDLAPHTRVNVAHIKVN
ncbi:MAG: helix-turn-helix domain-containing protein [Methylophilaceae bacterium]